MARTFLSQFSSIVGMLVTCSWLAACGGTTTSTPTTTAVEAAPTSLTATATPSKAALGQFTKIRVGMVPLMISSPLFVAQERGYFQDEGLEVELTPIQSNDEALKGLAAGDLDVAVGDADVNLFNAVAQGARFKIFAPLHSERSPLTTSLVINAKRANEMKSVADLKGKKVAINATGAATEYWLDQALEKNGLALQDIQLTIEAFPDVAAALEDGSLDAAVLSEPLIARGVEQGTLKVLANDFINGFTPTYLYMSNSLIDSPNSTPRSFLRAYLRACRDLQGAYMTPEIAAIIEKYTQVPAAVVQKATLPEYNPDGKIPVQDIQALQTYFLSRGELRAKELIDMTPFVDQSLAEQVTQSLDQ